MTIPAKYHGVCNDSRATTYLHRNSRLGQIKDMFTKSTKLHKWDDLRATYDDLLTKYSLKVGRNKLHIPNRNTSPI